MGILKWQLALSFTAHIISTSYLTWTEPHKPFYRKNPPGHWVHNELSLTGVRQPQVRETDGAGTNAGMEDIMIRYWYCFIIHSIETLKYYTLQQNGAIPWIFLKLKSGN